MKDELDSLLIEWRDGDRPAGDPAVLIQRGQLLRETLLDADDQLVERCGQHGGEVNFCQPVGVGTPRQRREMLANAPPLARQWR
jgi:hypothetical protein